MNGVGGEVDSFRARYAFRPDAFQERAIEEIAAGRSVLVSAPTGAGKTLIAEFAIWLALSRQRRIVYTTPLKALSNQKFADFGQQHGEERVGLLTGDVKVNPDAPILVMTTEILRNMLFAGPLPGLAFIVLDEFHFLGDESRGTVWEEIVVHAPRDVQLVALSATVGNLGELAEWINESHGPIVPITETHRPVPLDFRFYTPDGAILSEGDALQLARRPMKHFERRHGRRFDRSFGAREPRGFRPDVTKVIESLRQRGWLPCLYFIFSRAGCEANLETALGADLDLLSEDEAARVATAIQEWQAAYPGLSSGSTVYELVTTGLKRGMGVHHAGILPALKRLTEKLFEDGLCKVVFATETMSLGIHMPARSVFLQEMRKRGEAGFRGLTSGEITQMAGRAGRRGIDKAGTCLVGLEDPRTSPEAVRVIHGPVEPVTSRFQLRYSSAVLLLLTEPSLTAIRATMERSFAQFQRRRQIAESAGEVTELTARKAEADTFQPSCADIGNLHRYHSIASRMEQARQELGAARRAVPKRLRGKWRGAFETQARLDAMGREMALVPCHECPWKSRPKCESSVKTKRRLADRLDQHKSRVQTLQDSSWELFLRVLDLLQHFGLVEKDSHKVTPTGRLTGDIRHENELLVTQAAVSGVLSELPPRDLAALLSCLVEGGREPDEGLAIDFLRKRAHLKRRLESLEKIRDQIEREQRSRGLVLPVHLQTGYLAAAYEWAGGSNDWLGLVTEFWGGHEGDLIRAFRRLIDLCRQLEGSPHSPAPLRPRIRELLPLLDRGIVLDSALL